MTHLKVLDIPENTVSLIHCFTMHSFEYISFLFRLNKSSMPHTQKRKWLINFAYTFNNSILPLILMLWTPLMEWLNSGKEMHEKY